MKLSIMSPTDSEQEGLAPTIAVCAAAGIFGLWTAFSSPQWFDSAEFGAVGSTLSVSHAPGHPLHALMVKGAQLLPFGDVAFRSNASSAIALAIALGCFYRLLRRLVPEAPVLVAACVALTPALMPAIWLQGARGEVYALQFCISVLIADYCFRLVSSRDPRHLLLVAFLMGLGGALHSLITALMAPIVIWAMLVALPRNAKGLRTIAWSVLACFAGLATNAYLIIRASAGGDVGWGKPDNLSALWDTLTGREWYAGYESPPVDVHENIISIMSYCIEQLGAPAALLLFLVAVAGIGALLERVERNIRSHRLLSNVLAPVPVVQELYLLRPRTERNPDGDASDHAPPEKRSDGDTPVHAPALSVVVIAYNEQECIDEAVHTLQSALEGARIEHELVLIDDGSTDETPLLMDALGDNDARIRVIHQPNKGIGAALRAGFDAALGAHVTWVPADGQIAPDVVVELHRRRHEAPMLTTVYRTRDDPWYRMVISQTLNTLITLRSGQPAKSGGNYLFERSLWDAHGPKGDDSMMISSSFRKALREAGHAITEVQIDCRARQGGHSKVLNRRAIGRTFVAMLRMGGRER